MHFSQYPGWTLAPDGSLFMATVNDDAAGMYRCTPYNSYGTMGTSGPTSVILQVSVQSRPPGSLTTGMLCITWSHCNDVHRQITFHAPQIPPLWFRCDLKAHRICLRICPVLMTELSIVIILISHNCICHSKLKTLRETTFYWPFYSDVSPLTLIEVNSE